MHPPRLRPDLHVGVPVPDLLCLLGRNAIVRKSTDKPLVWL
ncbi:MAG: hypothetical protein ACRDVE_06355 [Actinocrinis sp.]